MESRKVFFLHHPAPNAVWGTVNLKLVGALEGAVLARCRKGHRASAHNQPKYSSGTTLFCEIDLHKSDS